MTEIKKLKSGRKKKIRYQKRDYNNKVNHRIGITMIAGKRRVRNIKYNKEDIKLKVTMNWRNVENNRNNKM